MSTEEIKLQVLSKHYDDTFALIQGKIVQRDKVFYLAILMLVVILFQIYSPTVATEIITQVIAKKLATTVKIDFSFIDSVIWFCLSILLVKYYQTVVYLERQYAYIHRIEEEIEKDCKVFSREGKSYLDNYPAFLNWSHYLYTIIFPILLIVITAVKIRANWKSFGLSPVLKWLNLVLFFFILISTMLYLKSIFWKSDPKKA